MPEIHASSMAPASPLRGIGCALLALLFVACGGESVSVTTFPVIEVGADQLDFTVGNVQPGQTISQFIEIRNTGTETLTLHGITLNYEAVGAAETEGNVALELASLPTFPAKIAVLQSGTSSAPERLQIEVVYRRVDDLPRTAQLVIASDDPANEKVTLEIEVAEGAPVMRVVPDTVEFRAVHAGDSPRSDVRITNTGNANLQVRRMVLLGDDVFSVVVDEEVFGVNEEIAFEVPLEIPPQRSFPFEVQFVPFDELPKEARLVVFGNTSESTDGLEVPVFGNKTGPCIEVTPQKVDFGAKLKGGKLSEIQVDVHSCGEEELRVVSARLSDPADADNEVLADLGVVPSSPQFDLDFTETTAEGESPTEQLPWRIPINQTGSFKVLYTTPDTESPKDQNGEHIADRGFVILRTNAFREFVEIEVTGFSVSVVCPTAIIEIEEGTNVIPQTLLHFSGTKSFSASGSINKYNWSVEQPEGSTSQFVPGANFSTPVFEVNAAGEYVFQLVVWDTTGQESCDPAREVVTVTPDEAIHVELLWTTPGDPDEFDDGPRAGTDLDLHFVHPYAGGQDLDNDGVPDGYFDDRFDCFWFYPHQDWGTVDPNVDDNPGLDRDDTDGAGPENLNLNVPEDDVTYKVGVHYWQDPTSTEHPAGFGPVLATLRVYIFGDLRWNKDDVELAEKDMWEVCTIDWPDQSVRPISGTSPGGLKIIPNYVNPFFVP